MGFIWSMSTNIFFIYLHVPKVGEGVGIVVGSSVCGFTIRIWLMVFCIFFGPPF